MWCGKRQATLNKDVCFSTSCQVNWSWQLRFGGIQLIQHEITQLWKRDKLWGQWVLSVIHTPVLFAQMNQVKSSARLQHIDMQEAFYIREWDQRASLFLVDKGQRQTSPCLSSIIHVQCTKLHFSIKLPWPCLLLNRSHSPSCSPFIPAWFLTCGRQCVGFCCVQSALLWQPFDFCCACKVCQTLQSFNL